MNAETAYNLCAVMKEQRKHLLPLLHWTNRFNPCARSIYRTIVDLCAELGLKINRLQEVINNDPNETEDQKQRYLALLRE